MFINKTAIWGEVVKLAFFQWWWRDNKKRGKERKGQSEKKKSKRGKREKEKEGKEKEGVNREEPQLIPILPMLSVRGVLDGIAAGDAVGEFVGLSGDAVGI